MLTNRPEDREHIPEIIVSIANMGLSQRLSPPQCEPQVLHAGNQAAPSTTEKAARSIGAFSLIPQEIFDNICEFLGNNGVRRLRATCREMRDITDPYAFREVNFCLHVDDFAALHAIAHHPTYPQFVRKLTYNTTIFDPRLVVDKTKGIVLSGVQDFGVKMYSDRNLIFPGLQKVEKHNPEKWKQESDERKRRWMEAERVLTAQRRIFETNYDVTLFKEILPKFINLREISVSTSATGTPRTPFDIFPHCLLSTWIDEQEHTGIRHLPTLMEGIRAAGASMENLKRFRAGFGFHWLSLNPTVEKRSDSTESDTSDDSDDDGAVDSSISMFFSPPDLKLVNAGWPLLDNLTHFEISIDDMTHYHEIMPYPTKLLCLEALGSNIIQMRNLETLIINIENHLDSDCISCEVKPPVPLARLIPAGQHWPRLKKLDLGRVATNRGFLTKLLIRHKETLTTVGLQGIHLENSSWMAFFPKLRKAWLPKRLQVSLYGYLFGRREDLGPGSDLWECWCMDSESGDIMTSKLLRDYMLDPHGIEYLPLDPSDIYPEDEF